MSSSWWNDVMNRRRMIFCPYNLVIARFAESEALQDFGKSVNISIIQIRATTKNHFCVFRNDRTLYSHFDHNFSTWQPKSSSLYTTATTTTNEKCGLHKILLKIPIQ